MKFEPAALSAIVDRCSELRAQIDNLEQEKKQLEAVLIEQGQPKYVGSLHNVTVAYDLVKTSIDWKSIAYRLGDPSRQLIQAYSKTSDPYNRVSYFARSKPC